MIFIYSIFVIILVNLENESWINVEDVADLIMAREMHSSHILSLKLKKKSEKKP